MVAAISGPAGSAPGGFQPAVRNPIYSPSGGIIGGSAPGGAPTPYSSVNYGNGRNFARQLAMLNRRDPAQAGSLTEEELRQMAQQRLGR